MGNLHIGCGIAVNNRSHILKLNKNIAVIGLLCGLGLGLVGCTQFPDLDKRIDSNASNAPYPALIPGDKIIAARDEIQTKSVEDPALDARVARLKSRAARLRNATIDAPTRARMRDGVDQTALTDPSS